MRLLPTLLLCLLLPAAALSQIKPLLEHRGEFRFGDGQGRVIAHRLIEGENRLVLAGPRVVKVLDFANAKLSDALTLDVTSLGEDGARVISPDGRRMIVFGNYDSARKEGKAVRAAAVWDLRTGTQIAALDKTSKPVRAAVWSENGRTLATSSDRYAPSAADSSSIEVAFWDGETFEYKNSLPSDKAGWWRLTEDGGACLFTTGEVKGFIPLIDSKYVSRLGPVSVWDIAAAKVGRAVASREGGVERKVRDIEVSPDGRFLALVWQPAKSKDSERRLAVWGIGGAPAYELTPRYEIKPPPKIVGGTTFSTTGRYFALDTGKSLQVYETGTGAKRFELPNFGRPTAWLNDDIFYTDRGTRMTAFDVATGRELYRHRVIYETYTDSSGSYDPSDTMPRFELTRVADSTKIVAHPRGELFLTYSNQYVKVFNARTGELLQTLVEPPVDYTKKKPRLSTEPLVSKAHWSADGKTLYVISADERSISLWRLLED